MFLQGRAIAFCEEEGRSLYFHLTYYSNSVVFPHHFFSQNRRAFIMEYLLIVNRFIPKSATRLTAGLARYAITIAANLCL
jgi:hypothetical protein